MRQRNRKWAQPYLDANLKYVVRDFPVTESLFDNNLPIHVEIGTGKGDFIVEMAKKNAIENKVASRLEILSHDVLKSALDGSFDAVISNPPYIRRDVLPTLSREVQNEPTAALDGGEDGLDIIRFLIGDGLSYLRENGHMLIEFGYDQGLIMDKMLKEKMDTGSIKFYEILKDYGSNPRVAVITK